MTPSKVRHRFAPVDPEPTDHTGQQSVPHARESLRTTPRSPSPGEPLPSGGVHRHRPADHTDDVPRDSPRPAPHTGIITPPYA